MDLEWFGPLGYPRLWGRCQYWIWVMSCNMHNSSRSEFFAHSGFVPCAPRTGKERYTDILHIRKSTMEVTCNKGTFSNFQVLSTVAQWLQNIPKPFNHKKMHRSINLAATTFPLCTAGDRDPPQQKLDPHWRTKGWKNWARPQAIRTSKQLLFINLRTDVTYLIYIYIYIIYTYIYIYIIFMDWTSWWLSSWVYWRHRRHPARRSHQNTGFRQEDVFKGF